jgi:iron-sulfur cluster repair protein YtfE (RIC family)
MNRKQASDQSSTVSVSFTKINSPHATDEFMNALQVFGIDREEGKKLLHSFPQGKIIDFLCQNHNMYLNKLIPEIEQQFLRILQMAPQHQSMTLKLFALFRSFEQELKEHIIFEEKAMFPVIRSSYSGAGKQNTNIFSQTHQQHDEEVFEILEALVKESDNLGHLMPFRMLLEKLKVLHSELRLHAAIEDELLFKKVTSVINQSVHRLRLCNPCSL